MSDNKGYTALSERALLVCLSMSKPSASKKDKQLAEETATVMNGQKEYFSDVKKLFVSQTYDDIRKLDGWIGNQILRPNTLPWSDGSGGRGRRLMPAEILPKVRSQIEDAFSQREELIKKIGEEYDEIIADARQGLGRAFNENDYKTKDQFLSQFKHSFGVEKIPEGKDLRFSAANDAIEMERQNLDRLTTDRINNAMADLHNRLYNALTELVDGLERHGKQGGQRKQKFNDFTVEKVQKLIDILPAMNITGDPMLDSAYQELSGSVTGTNPKALREDDSHRSSVVDSARKVLESLGGMYS